MSTLDPMIQNEINTHTLLTKALAAPAKKTDAQLRDELTELLEHGATRHDGEWWVPVPEAVDTVMDWMPGGDAA